MQEQLTMEVGPCTSKPVFPAGFYKGRPRPNRMSDEVLAEVANKLMPRVLQWLNESSDYVDEEIAVQVKAALEASSDGYEMANYLDYLHGWDADAELVEIMDGADFYDAERQAVMAWIKDNDIKPRFEVGMVVTVKLKRDQAEHRGEITKINEDGAYTVFIPDLGHVRQGVGTHGLIFDWEYLEGLNPCE